MSHPTNPRSSKCLQFDGVSALEISIPLAEQAERYPTDSEPSMRGSEVHNLIHMYYLYVHLYIYQLYAKYTHFLQVSSRQELSYKRFPEIAWNYPRDENSELMKNSNRDIWILKNKLLCLYSQERIYPREPNYPFLSKLK